VVQLIENDNRRDFLEALFDYNDDVRAVLVNNRGLLIETAVVNGSWQSTYTILAHCMLMRREEVLAELMIPLLTSEIYFIAIHNIRYSQGVVSSEHIKPHHSWKKCIDVLMRFGLTQESYDWVLHSISSGPMRKLIKRVLKTAKPQTFAPRNPLPIDPIQVAPATPVRFERFVKEDQHLRTGPFTYLSPKNKYGPKPSSPKSEAVEEQHPLVVYWKHRLEESQYVRDEVESDITHMDFERPILKERTNLTLQVNKSFQEAKKRTYSPTCNPYLQPMGIPNKKN